MKVLFSILVILFSNYYLFGQIELIGHVVDEGNNKLKDIQVNVYDGNQLVINETASKKFDFFLSNNKHYTIELSKAGYYTKRIIVETNTDKPTDPFEFKVELLRINDEIDETSFDFPVAIIKYKEKKGFYFKSIKNYNEEKTLITQN